MKISKTSYASSPWGSWLALVEVGLRSKNCPPRTLEHYFLDGDFSWSIDHI